MGDVDRVVRTGFRGAWDRFVGPGQSRVERAGTAGALVAGIVWGDHHLGATARPGSRWLMRLVAADLWGGVWVNNTPSCVRWYERPGQGSAEHFGFAALHVVHPTVIGLVDVREGNRGARSAARWVLGNYAWMLTSSLAIRAAPARARLPFAVAASVVGIALDRRLGVSNAAPWFGPVYDAKLLIGHAAGSAWAVRR